MAPLKSTCFLRRRLALHCLQPHCPVVFCYQSGIHVVKPLHKVWEAHEEKLLDGFHRSVSPMRGCPGVRQYIPWRAHMADHVLICMRLLLARLEPRRSRPGTTILTSPTGNKPVLQLKRLSRTLVPPLLLEQPPAGVSSQRRATMYSTKMTMVGHNRCGMCM